MRVKESTNNNYPRTAGIDWNCPRKTTVVLSVGTIETTSRDFQEVEESWTEICIWKMSGLETCTWNLQYRK